MPNWKKIIVSGSDAALNSLSITSTLNVTGSTFLSASSGIALQLYGSGSTIFSISGSSSEIFRISDDGSSSNLFSVSSGSTTILSINSNKVVSISGSLVVTGSITGTLFGTASWATNALTASYVTGSVFTSTNPALSASYAVTASYALNGGGSATPGGANTQVQFNRLGAFSGSSAFTFNSASNQVTISEDGQLFITGSDGAARVEINNFPGPSTVFMRMTAIASSSMYLGYGWSSTEVGLYTGNDTYLAAWDVTDDSFHYSNDFYIYSGSKHIFTNVVSASAGVTGSLFGTSSWARNALTASYGNITGSLFGTSSWAQNVLTASYVTSSNVYGPNGANSILSASYATTASFITGSIFTSTNPALSASYAVTSSYSLSTQAAGVDRNIQFNDNGILGSDNKFQYTADQTLVQGSHTSVLNNELNSFIHGDNNTYSSNNSHAEGINNYLYGDGAHVEGNGSTAGAHGLSASFSNSTGSLSGSYGDLTLYFLGGELYFYDPDYGKILLKTYNSSSYDGTNTYVYLDEPGFSTTTTPGFYIAESGFLNLGQSSIFGNYSHAEGTIAVAIGNYSHAEGFGATAIGNYSHAEGRQVKAIGEGSHAEGFRVKSIGNHSHAEGAYSIAYGAWSHAGGSYTIASASYGTVVGQYNKHNNTTDLFTIGDGADENNRHDLVNAGIGYFNITGSVGVLGGITGSLLGTASIAATVPTQIATAVAYPATFYPTLVNSSNITPSPEVLFTSVDTTNKGFKAIIESDGFVTLSVPVISSSLTSGVGFVGTASWANNALTASKVNTVRTTNNADYYLTFVDSLNGGTGDFEQLYTSAGPSISYNPSTNALSVTRITASLHGTASWAQNLAGSVASAAQVETIYTSSTALFYPTFVDSKNITATAEKLYTGEDSGKGIYIIPNATDGVTFYSYAISSSVVFSTANPNVVGFIGTASWAQSASIAKQVETIRSNTNATHYLTFVDSSNSSAAAETLYTQTNITYNPSTLLLSATNLSATSITGSIISASSGFIGNLTGSLQGTASYVTGSIFTSTNPALSASYALTASYALNGGGGPPVTPGGANTTIQFNSNGAFSGSANFTFNSASNAVQLTGSLEIADGTNTFPVLSTSTWKLYDQVASESINWDSRILYDPFTSKSIEWGTNRNLYDVNEQKSIDYASRVLYNDDATKINVNWSDATVSGYTAATLYYNNVPSLDWKNRNLIDNNSNTALSYTDTGSANGVRLYGTASYALTASFVATASYVSSIKSGVVSTFTGTPRTGTVTFGTAYPNANYAVTVTGGTGVARSWTVESKTTTGFTINSNSNTAISGEVNWIAVPYNS